MLVRRVRGDAQDRQPRHPRRKHFPLCLIELNGDDLRRAPLEGRKARLEIVLAKAAPGIHSTRTWRATARSCFGTPAHSALTYVVEFKTAGGEALAISVPVGETRVLKHFQERMPYGLFVPDVS